MLPIKSCSTFCLIKKGEINRNLSSKSNNNNTKHSHCNDSHCSQKVIRSENCIISPAEWAKSDHSIIPTKGVVMWRDTSHTMRCLQHIWVRWRLFNRQVYSSVVSGHHKQNRFCKIWHMNPCHAMCFCSSTYRRHDGQQHDHKNNSSRRYPRTRQFLFPTRWFTTMAK